MVLMVRSECLLDQRAMTVLKLAKVPKTFAQVLLDWRTKHAWTRKEAAMKLAVSWRTLQDWEQGRRIPSQMAQSGVFAQMSKIDDIDSWDR
jgi:DNA-binding transcriptional regulator YiaG